MRGFLSVVLMCVAVLSALCQTPSSKYQPGTIIAVTPRQSPEQHDTDVTQYDVSVRVGNMSYLVLYKPSNGANTVKFAAGMDLLVPIGTKTLTFNSALSGKTEVPILSRATLSAQNLDWSKACGQYFSLKLQHLSQNLALTDDQQTQIKPILEQEAGEVGEICGNPVLSRKDTLSQYEKILQTSDKKIKPLLSPSQLAKLLDLRRDQKQDVKRIIAEQTSSKQN